MHRELRFIVPGNPIGINQVFCGGKRPFVKTTRARNFAAAVAHYGRRAWAATDKDMPWQGRATVYIDLFFRDRRPDIDGPIKAILDALQPSRPQRSGAGIINNDRQVAELHVRRYVDKEDPRAEITVHLTEG